MNKQTDLKMALMSGLIMMGCSNHFDTEATEASARITKGEITVQADQIETFWYDRKSGFTSEEMARRYSASLRVDLRNGDALATLDSEICGGSFVIDYQIARSLAQEILNAPRYIADVHVMDAGVHRITYKQGGETFKLFLGMSSGSYGKQTISDEIVRPALDKIIAERQSTCTRFNEVKTVRASRSAVSASGKLIEKVRAEIHLEKEGVLISATVESRDPLTGKHCSAFVGEYVAKADLAIDAQGLAIEENSPCRILYSPVVERIRHSPLQVSLKFEDSKSTPWARLDCSGTYRVSDPHSFLMQVNKILMERQNCIKDPFQLGTK